MPEINDANILKGDLVLDFANRRVMVLSNYPGGPGKLQNFITFEAIQDLNQQIEEVSVEKKDEKLKKSGFSTKADVVNYVKSMNIHILIWVSCVLEQVEILRRHIGEKQVSKSPGLESGFNFVRVNVKSIMQLIDRMEEGLDIRREDHEL